MSDAPLGVFDSGLGGLTVVRALRARMPGERVIYLGDTARVPYGPRSSETILRYSRSCAGVLVERGVKSLVVACNTATSVALEMLRAELDMPVVGVVDPGAEAAVAIALGLFESGDIRGGRVGVLGTTRTIASGAYVRAVAGRSSRIEVIGQPAPLLVPLVEEGWVDGDVPRLAVERYLAPLIDAGVGAIVLGCTHYPILKDLIAEAAARLAGRPIAIVDSADATARAVAELLDSRGLTAKSSSAPLELLVTDYPSSFAAMAERCLGGSVPKVREIEI